MTKRMNEADKICNQPKQALKEELALNGFKCDEDIYNTSQKFTITDVEGYKYFTNISQVRQCGYKMLIFHTGNPYSIDNIRLHFNVKFNNMIEVLEGQEYKGRDVPLNVNCRIHGLVKITLHSTQKVRGSQSACPKCIAEDSAKSRSKKLDDNIRDFRIAHGDKYDYDHVEEDLIHSKSKVRIICKSHGIFKMTPNNHVRGYGCRKCYIEGRDFLGWSFSEWEKAGLNSDNFSGFKTYLIRCWSDDCSEIFYKVGITFNEITKRFNLGTMPYNWEVIEIINFGDNARKAWDTEKRLHRENKSHRYIPKVFFGGHYTECLDCLVTLEEASNTA